MSPETAKYRAELPLTERWIARGVTYCNPKRAAAKADRVVRRSERRAHARRLGYRGPRVLDSQWPEAS